MMRFRDGKRLSVVAHVTLKKAENWKDSETERERERERIEKGKILANCNVVIRSRFCVVQSF